MSVQTKPSIVFAHGLWADGSCFNEVIPALQAEGHEVVSAQNSLDTLKGDVVAVIRTWYIVGKNDHTVHPELQRFVAKRMGASIHETDSSHVPMLSKPAFVIDVIRTAANAVQGRPAQSRPRR